MRATLSQIPGVKMVFCEKTQYETIYSIVHEAESFPLIVSAIDIANEVHSLPNAGITTIKYRKE